MIKLKPIKTLLQKRSYDFKLPVNYSQEDKEFFKNEVVKNFDEVKLYQTSKVNITAEGILFWKFKIHPISYIWEKHKKDFSKKYLIKQYFSKKKEIINSAQPILVCFDYWSVGYYHWICECLPRIYIASKQLKNPLILLPESYKRDYIQSSLKLLHINSVKYFSHNNYVSCKNVFLTNKLCPSGDIEVQTIKNLAHELTYNNPLVDANNSSYKLVYVSRKKATKRKVNNEPEVEKLVIELGFEVICFEDYTFSQQINLLKNTQLLVAAHGANLTNMLFMPQQSSVLELRRHDNDGRNFYLSLAAVNNQNYYYLKCKTIDQTHDLFDLIVDLNDLKNLIETIYNKTSHINNNYI